MWCFDEVAEPWLIDNWENSEDNYKLKIICLCGGHDELEDEARIAAYLVQTRMIPHVCIIRGGIDSFVVDAKSHVVYGHAARERAGST